MPTPPTTRRVVGLESENRPKTNMDTEGLINFRAIFVDMWWCGATFRDICVSCSSPRNVWSSLRTEGAQNDSAEFSRSVLPACLARWCAWLCVILPELIAPGPIRLSPIRAVSARSLRSVAAACAAHIVLIGVAWQLAHQNAHSRFGPRRCLPAQELPVVGPFLDHAAGQGDRCRARQPFAEPGGCAPGQNRLQRCRCVYEGPPRSHFFCEVPPHGSRVMEYNAGPIALPFARRRAIPSRPRSPTSRRHRVWHARRCRR